MKTTLSFCVFAFLGALNGTPANLNPVGVRIVHNGTQFKFYLNSNPVDGDGNFEGDPNEYSMTGSVNSTFNTNLNFMVGAETPRPDTEMQWLEFQ